MRRYLVIAACLLTVLLVAACDSKNTEKCPEGYHWDDTTGQCELNTSVTDNEQDIDIVKDDAAVVDEDTLETDTELPDEGYTGPCVHAANGGTALFDITERTVTIGALTVGGAADNAALTGELWGENNATKSEFMIAAIAPALSGKKFRFADGTYNLFYRGPRVNDTDPPQSPVAIAAGIAINADRTLDIDLPLYTYAGSVTKNGAPFPALSPDKAAATKITLQSGGYLFDIPYDDFADFTVLVPKGNYTVSFSGHLTDGAPLFTGKALFGTTALTIDEDISAPVELETVTLSGVASVEGVAVNSGAIAIVKDPPLEQLAVALIPDLGATKNYSVEVLANEGIAYTVLYLANIADYPYSFLRLTEWTDLTATAAPILDFGRIHGAVSFKGGDFPDLATCTAAETQCTRGRLKAMSLAGGTVVVKDLGVTGADFAYEGFVVRRQKFVDPQTSEVTYAPYSFSLIFESYLNDLTGMTNYLPFSMKVRVNGLDSFQFISGSEYTTDMQLNVTVAPVRVSGTVTHNGGAIGQTDGDLLFVRNIDTQTETPVVNLSELTGGNYSFFVPPGSYEMVYRGKSFLGHEQRGVIDTELTAALDDIAGRTLDIGTVKLSLDLTVNGVPLKEFIAANGAIDRYDLSAVNDKNSLGQSAITAVDAQPLPYLKLLKSPSWDLYLNLYVKEGAETSSFRFPLAQLVNVAADSSTQATLSVVSFTGDVRANGEPVGGATLSRGLIDLSGATRAKVYLPPSGGARLFVSPGEYATPYPQFTQGDGFDLAQKLTLPCLFVE